VTAPGYIPEGGVWTREERNRDRAGQIKNIPRTVALAHETVAALLAALKDAENEIQHAIRQGQTMREARGYISRCGKTNERRALIAEVEK
jgi:hypothetical protein